VGVRPTAASRAAPFAHVSSTVQPPTRYKRYRTLPRALRSRPHSERERQLERLATGHLRKPLGLPRRRPRIPGEPAWRRWTRPGRIMLVLLALLVGWMALSVALFLASAAFEEQGPSDNVSGVLDSGGFPLTSANNILVLGSDQRPSGSHEPGASTSGPSRSDVIMLIRTGGGHAARLSIPRDMIVDIPGHGLQKINAAYAFGGARLAIQTVKALTGVPINHLVEINFANFPRLIDAMGGVTYTGGCVYAKVDGGYARGGVTLRLKAGTHHLDGRQALALARVRHNSCNAGESDLTREGVQQVIFNDMKSQLLSVHTFLHLPWVSWDAPQAIRSDMSGPTLLMVFGALAFGGSPQTRLLEPTGQMTLADGSVGLTVTPAAVRAAVRRFESG
jgi:LCP family protein required for cell wall assembly